MASGKTENTEVVKAPSAKFNAAHALVWAIFDEILEELPPERDGKPKFRRCRTMFGMMQTFLQKVETSSVPVRDCVEIQKLKVSLRQQLEAASPNKGVPQKMTKGLKELRDLLEEIIVYG